MHRDVIYIATACNIVVDAGSPAGTLGSARLVLGLVLV